MTTAAPPAPTSQPNRTRAPLILGVTALGGGLWLLLNALGVGIPQFKDLWPALLILAGCACLADYLWLSRIPSSVGWAITWIGLGVLFLALTFDYTELRKILDWLPSFPTIFGLSWLATWLVAGRKSTNLFIAGLICLALGLVGFAARFDVLQHILPSAQIIWAVMFLVAGGYLIWRVVRRA
jgi:hypothetical protein